tara:strand:- start:25270 stop:25878 length:609 start_codon:yes stop_codon:yes gene_type:complete
MSIVILDLNLSNLKSLANSLNQIGIKYRISNNEKIIKNAKKIILPGVGSFTDAMDSLKQKKIVNTLIKLRESKKPLLGICLGMQILADVGNENKKKNGLGFIPGEVKRLPKRFVDQIPNIGWCSVKIKKEHFIFEGIPNQSFFYFIHSYYYVCNEKFILGSTGDFFKFPSVICKENFIGVQFHPEKSYDFGLKLLSNFCKNE